MLKNEEVKAFSKKPQERIIRMVRQKELVVETIEHRLAEHLGRVLHRAHQGELNMHWAGGADICRVTWERRL